MSDRAESVMPAECRRKAAFYRDHAEKARTTIEREYWMRIAEHWREMADGSVGESDDQIN